MATKFYRDAAGNYLGGFDGAAPPGGAIEIPAPPTHGSDKWDGSQWVPTVERYNAPIKAQIAALDLKRIRPLAEGDTLFLAKLNDQIKALRAQLK